MPQIDPRKLLAGGYHTIRPLPAHNPQQAGPNCGLYALSYVMRHWYLKLQPTAEAIAQPLPARKVDVEGANKLAVGDPSKGSSLRYIAKHANTTHPLTFLGELFSGESLATVARQAGFEAKIHTPVTKNYLSTLYKLIDANHPALPGHFPGSSMNGARVPLWSAEEKLCALCAALVCPSSLQTTPIA